MIAAVIDCHRSIKLQVLHLHHSFDMGTTWSERGSVAVHSTRSGSASVEQASLESHQVPTFGPEPVKPEIEGGERFGDSSLIHFFPSLG